jgi:hypothetical protein
LCYGWKRERQKEIVGCLERGCIIFFFQST